MTPTECEEGVKCQLRFQERGKKQNLYKKLKIRFTFCDFSFDTVLSFADDDDFLSADRSKTKKDNYEKPTARHHCELQYKF